VQKDVEPAEDRNADGGDSDKAMEKSLVNWNATETTTWLRSLSINKDIDTFIKRQESSALTGADLSLLTLASEHLAVCADVNAVTAGKLLSAITNQMLLSQSPPSLTIEALSNWIRKFTSDAKVFAPFLTQLENKQWTIAQAMDFDAHSKQLTALLSYNTISKLVPALDMFKARAVASAPASAAADAPSTNSNLKSAS